MVARPPPEPISALQFSKSQVRNCTTAHLPPPCCRKLGIHDIFSLLTFMYRIPISLSGLLLVVGSPASIASGRCPSAVARHP